MGGDIIRVQVNIKGGEESALNDTTEERAREKVSGKGYTYPEIPENKKRGQNLREVLKTK